MSKKKAAKKTTRKADANAPRGSAAWWLAKAGVYRERGDARSADECERRAATAEG